MQSGHAQTIVMIHGIGVAGDYFVPLANYLSDTYDVIIPDMPGYGTSPNPDHVLTIEESVEIVAGIVDHFGLDGPILVGQSMGCQVIAHLLDNHPQRFPRAILISPSTNKAERSIRMQAARLCQDIFHETLKMDLVTLKDYLQMGIVRFLKTARFMVNDAIEDSLSRSAVPVLFIRGEKDKIVPQPWLDFLLTVTPHSTSSIHAGAPHNLHYTNARHVANDIEAFVG